MEEKRVTALEIIDDYVKKLGQMEIDLFEEALFSFEPKFKK